MGVLGFLLAVDAADAHVALQAQQTGHAVVTSDPQDLRDLAPGLRLIEV